MIVSPFPIEIEGSLAQISIHECSKLMWREMGSWSPEFAILMKEGKVCREDVMVVPVVQKAEHDLVEWNDVVAREKDELLERFVRWARRLCNFVKAKGYWLDVSDPCSGYPVCFLYICLQ